MFHRSISESVRKRLQRDGITETSFIGYRTVWESAAVSSSFAFSSCRFSFSGERGVSAAFQKTLEEAERVAAYDSPVHIFGESGTGKELIAQAIHQNSGRRNGPFVAVNCGAIPRELMESELFGYVEGAFTGAKRKGHRGKLLQAQGGTLFLDEIGEIPPAMQVALLRVLQEKKVTPLGSTRSLSLDIRIITATHKDLWKLVQCGTFREDLFFRLYVYPIRVPPLRERREDIPYLIRAYCRENHWAVEWPAAVMEFFLQYQWPGNVRELLNVLERMRILCDGGCLDFRRIQPVLEEMQLRQEGAGEEERTPPAAAKRLSFREEIQRQEILRALEQTGGRVSTAARLLKMSRSTFYRRMRKFEL